MQVDESFENTRPLFRWQQADVQLTPLVVARRSQRSSAQFSGARMAEKLCVKNVRTERPGCCAPGARGTQKSKFGSTGRNGRSSASVEQRSERGSFAVKCRRGETCGIRVEALGARTDSVRPCKGSCGARPEPRPRGVRTYEHGAGLGRAAGGETRVRCQRVAQGGRHAPSASRASTRRDSDRRRVGVCVRFRSKLVGGIT